GTCGGVFNGSGCVASPNYGQGNYNLNELCVYKIEVPPGQRVELTLLEYHIEYSSSCFWDWLEINIGDDNFPIRRYCGDSSSGGSFLSTSNTMT
ncbi:CUB domain-containing protein, partial [Salmonella sp. s51090]|uniref:CUB domain-containing protein n=1 Tax=Salmonella sp. s51090 TaxID=3159651 RepID=UPI00397F73A6